MAESHSPVPKNDNEAFRILFTPLAHGFVPSATTTTYGRLTTEMMHCVNRIEHKTLGKYIASYVYTETFSSNCPSSVLSQVDLCLQEIRIGYALYDDNTTRYTICVDEQGDECHFNFNDGYLRTVALIRRNIYIRIRINFIDCQIMSFDGKANVDTLAFDLPFSARESPLTSSMRTLHVYPMTWIKELIKLANEAFVLYTERQS